MGNQCGCSQKKLDQKEVTINELTFKQKIQAKRALRFMYVSNFRRKCQEIHSQTNQKLDYFRKNFAKFEPNIEDTNSIDSQYEKIISQCKETINKFGLEKEIDLDLFKDLSTVKKELKNYYVSQFEKRPNLIELLFYTPVDNKPEKQNLKDMVFDALKGSKKDTSKINQNLKRLGSNDQHLKDKIMEELDNLFNYREDKSQILKLCMKNNNKDGFDGSIKRLAHKFLILNLLSKGDYLESTNRNFVRVCKNDIRQVVRERCLNVTTSEIVDEDYKVMLSKINKTERDEEANLFKSIEPDNMSDDLNTKKRMRNKNKITFGDKDQIFSTEDSKRASKITSNPTSKNNLNIALINSTKLLANVAISFKSEQNSPVIHKQFASEKEEEVEVDKFTPHGLKKVGKKIRDMVSSDNMFKSNLKNKEIINKIPKKTKAVENKKIEFYRGEYDDINLLYCGTGNLVKPAKYSYTGTFRMGQKNGIGIIFKIRNDDTLYYRGEWTNNQMDGYGFAIIVDSKRERTIFQRGVFKQNKFEYGIQIFVTSKKYTEAIVERYEGELQDDMYKGNGSLYRKCYKFEKPDDKKFEVEYEYNYTGSFANNKENGQGKSNKNSFQTGYKYEYEGEFVDGKMHGEGKIEFEGEYYIKSYQGNFENDRGLCKYGVVVFRSGDVYEGFFNENRCKSVMGLYFHHDKKTNKKNENFFGEFDCDKKNGLGRFINSDNKLLVGRYTDGEKDGNFSLCYAQIQNGNNSEYRVDFSSGDTKGEKGKKADQKDDKLQTKNSTLVTTKKVKQIKTYFLFEYDEVIDKSDKPFKENTY